jgi:cell division protein FtsI (penicillin-binding protein 3)
MAYINHKNNNNSQHRFIVIFLLILISFIIIIARLLFLYEGGNVVITKKNPPQQERLDIIDRNQTILATNLLTYNLYAQPAIIRDKNKVLKDLNNIFKNLDLKSKNNIRVKLAKQKYKGRVLLLRDITPKEKSIIHNLGHVGLFFDKDYKRFYPHKHLTSHLIGFTGRDKKGLAGFEKYYDDQNLAAIYKKSDKISLSIDINIQNIIYRELDKTIKKFSAKGGVAVLMDINNGEIYSLVSMPSYNPYFPHQMLLNKNFNNKASYDLYEMGSTFKTFTMALALENNLINLKDKYDVSQNLNISRFTIKDFKKITEDITAKEIFIKSSNIGTAKIAQKFSKELQQEFFSRLELFSPLKIELVEKSYAKFPKKWGKTKIITSSYGYGISVTVLHLMQATAAILNGGYFVPATLIKGKNDDLVKTRVISNNTSLLIRSLFQGVVEQGTAKRASSEGYNIGGKTGTANKSNIGKGGYDESRLLSSFIAAFPIMNPQYLVFALLDEPKAIKETNYYATAGVVAAPLVKNIIEQVAPILEIAPQSF